MRAWAVGMVLAWWFSLLGMEALLRLQLPAQASKLLSVALALVLGLVLAQRLRLGQRAQHLHWVPLVVLVAAASWLMVAPLLLWRASGAHSTLQAAVEWGLAWLLVVGTGWVTMRLRPCEEPVLGPLANAPTVRLALGVGALLSACTALWLPPWRVAVASSELPQALVRVPVDTGDAVVQLLQRWGVPLLPFIAGAVLVWGLRLGPRVLVSRPGLTRINFYLVCWVLLQIAVLLVAEQSLEAMRSPRADNGLAGVALALMWVAPVVPLLNVVLMWAVVRMLFTLGAAPAAADVPDAAGATGPVSRPEAARGPGLPVVQEIRRLLGERKPQVALARYAEQQSRQPDFDPGTAAVVPLTKQALKQGRADLALQLLTTFGKRRPADTATPLFRWLHGQALLAVGRQSEGLVQLQALMLSHPEDPLAREARSVLSRQAG